MTSRSEVSGYRTSENPMSLMSGEAQKNASLADRTADRMASLGGSWIFLASFALVVALWITENTVLLYFHAFDPYPFILLNLILSCLAAVQAPVIMMSQNRASEIDRKRDEDMFMRIVRMEKMIERHCGGTKDD